MKVIIADDSRAMRRILSGMLQNLNSDFDFLMADGGDAVLAHLDDHSDVGLILLDWNMHVMNGLDCIRAIRSRKDGKDIPVVMISVETEGERILEAVRSGANRYLTKPFDAAQFHAVVSPFLAGRESVSAELVS